MTQDPPAATPPPQRSWHAPLLVVAIDAELREALFACLTGAGYRVDAVGAVRGASKRLTKDQYAAVIVAQEDEPGVGELLPAGTPVVTVTGDLTTLLEQVSDAVDPPRDT